MPEAILNFIKGDKVGAEADYRDALPQNMYTVAHPILGVDGYMLQMPGIVSIADGVGIDRGGCWNDKQDAHYRVSGDKFIKVDGSTITQLGTVTGTDQATLANSFNTQGIVAGGKFYLYDPVNGFVPNTDPDMGSPIDVVWVDNYYFFTDGVFIYHTDITNESSIDPLKYATAEFIPDYTYGVSKTEDNKVMVYGRYSIEYFINGATENFAFQRVPSRAMKIGIVGTHCKTDVAGRTYILGGRKEDSISLHRIGTGSADKLGTREVDKIIAKYSEAELSDSSIESFEHDGYTFVIVNLPNDTLLFNQNAANSFGPANAWTILQSDVNGDGTWRARNGVFDANLNRWVFGDKRDGRLGGIDSALSTQYGDIVEWLLYTPAVSIEGASIDEVDIQTVPGFTAFNDATVFISLTYNGITYGREWTEMYGDQGQYGARYIVRRMGYVSNWVGFKLRGASRSRMAFSRGVLTYG
jgi:hypothetical protein